MNLVYLAQRIREFRKKRMLTLEQLAERAQLTQSVLSKVENSRVTPSLAALGRIAEALGVTLSELVAGIDDERRMTVVRNNERPLVERDHPTAAFVYRSLAPTRHAKRIEPLMIELPAGAPREDFLSHGGEEFILVMKGFIEVECGQEKCHLGPGDSVYLDASEKHRVVNAGSSTAEILCVLSGEDHLPAPTNEESS
jgi:transcriptional regulator with XRE-family HTH domain